MWVPRLQVAFGDSRWRAGIPAGSTFMKPTIDLIKEHGQIRLMLRILEKITIKLEAGEIIPADRLENINEFLQVFGDKCHHGKEEKYLFPAIKAVGNKNDIKLVEELLTEHAQGRKYIINIAKAENARNYVALLTEHIRKEDLILFPIANQKLSAEKQAAMEKGFAQIEEKVIGPGRHEQFQTLLVRLRNTYLL